MANRNIIPSEPNIESEKALEKLLRSEVEKYGGGCYKWLSSLQNGLPDRICVMPSSVFFAEVKTTGAKPSKIQRVIHNRLQKQGAQVYVLDNSESIINTVKKHA